MININPGSENFFYWDPEQLQDYQDTERGDETVNTVSAPYSTTKQESSDFISSIASLIKNKGSVV